MSLAINPFIDQLCPGAKVLDLGCGSGRDSKTFQEKGFEVLAIDGAEEMVKHVKSLGIPAQQMLIEEIDFNNDFDAIWCCASLVHVQKKDLPDAFRRIHRALKPGGLGYVSFKKGEGEGTEKGRYFCYVTEEELCTYLKDFNNISISLNHSDLNQTPTTWISALFRS